MDDTQDLIDFEALDVRERRLKAEDVKKLLHSLNMQPGNIGTPSDHHPYQYINSPAVKGLPLFPVPLSQPMSISSSPSTNATPAQSIGPPVSEPGSSGNNSYHSCDSASNLGWEAFKDLSTIPPRVSTYDNFNHSEVSFGQHDDSVSVETSRASPEALNIHNPLSRSHLNQRRIPSENLIELDGSVDVVREFDPLAEETPKADTMRPRRKVQTGEGPSGSPLTIVNQLSNSMPKSSTASVQSGKKLISTKSFGFANIKLVRKDSGILIQLKQLEAKVLGKIYPNGVKTDETHWSHGVIISPRSKLTNPPWLVSSVKLIVHTSKDEAPLKFTCDGENLKDYFQLFICLFFIILVSTSVESLIYQIVYSSCSNNGEEPACSYALKVSVVFPVFLMP